jgi:prepilin peptidase CpaA
MTAAALAASLVFPAALLWAMASDLARFEIPNAAPLAILAAFPAYGLLAGFDGTALLWHAAAGLGALLVGAALFFGRALGGGDAKLLAAAALWVGPADLPRFLAATALIGGALAIVLLLFRLAPEPSWAAEGGWLRRLHARRREAPYAVAIGGAGLVWFAGSPLFAA